MRKTWSERRCRGEAGLESQGNPNDYTDDAPEELTAVVSLNEARTVRRETKDRHLFVRVRGAQLGQVTCLPAGQLRHRARLKTPSSGWPTTA